MEDNATEEKEAPAKRRGRPRKVNHADEADARRVRLQCLKMASERNMKLGAGYDDVIRMADIWSKYVMTGELPPEVPEDV